MAAGFSVKDALNKNSKAGIDESPRARFRTKDISIFKMYRNDMNFYSVEQIEELAGDILMYGLKQNLEEINFKMLPDEDTDDGYYYKFNEKVLFRTDSKTQMEYLRNGVGGMIIKPNEARRKLDMEDAEGGDVLLANGSIVPLTMAGAAYLKGESEQENTDEPEQPEEETEPDTEQPDTATEPDETDTAEDETDEEGGE